MKSKQNKSSFHSNNTSAILFLIIPLILLSAGLFLSLQVHFLFYSAGQIILSLFFFQCFILLHETGHYSFFKSRKINTVLGHIFAFISIIPFNSWTQIHNLHHRWTGWRDKDPTTSDTVNHNFGKIMKSIINVSWLTWFPLFTIGYRFSNYWKIPKLKRYLEKENLKHIHINMIVQLCIYLTITIFYFGAIMKLILPAYFLSLVISDLFILSQHSHIKMPIAGNINVKALRYSEQIRYTRSLHINEIISRYIFFNFNMHELHHVYPGMPSYHLNRLRENTPNKISFYKYVLNAKRMKGFDFVFNTSDEKQGGSDPLRK